MMRPVPATYYAPRNMSWWAFAWEALFWYIAQYQGHKERS